MPICLLVLSSVSPTLTLCRTSCLGDGAAHGGWGGSFHINEINKDNPLQTHPQVNPTQMIPHGDPLS